MATKTKTHAEFIQDQINTLPTLLDRRIATTVLYIATHNPIQTFPWLRLHMYNCIKLFGVKQCPVTLYHRSRTNESGLNPNVSNRFEYGYIPTTSDKDFLFELISEASGIDKPPVYPKQLRKNCGVSYLNLQHFINKFATFWLNDNIEFAEKHLGVTHVMFEDLKRKSEWLVAFDMQEIFLSKNVKK